MALNYIITDNSISVFIDGEPRVITSDNTVFKKVKDAVRIGDEETVKNLLDVEKRVEEFGRGKVKVKGGVVYYDGKPINSYLTRKILQLRDEGFDITPLVNFLENLEENPSYRAREELYTFLEYGQLPITEDGHFIAYKKVRADYADIYSGKFDNSVGAVCEMDRRCVDDNSTRTCSTGLHFASREYMKYYGSSTGNKVMAVKINPRDVVAIPHDYNNTKGRCCRYEVIAELGDNNGIDVIEDNAIFKSADDDPYKEASKYRGVTWDKHSGKFKAQLPRKPKNGGSRHIGYFITAKDAGEAVAEATFKYL